MALSTPVLDRKPHFDERSRNFGITKLYDSSDVVFKRKRIWNPRTAGPLDQGSEGRCVIFGWGGELAATPYRYQITNKWCNDKWPLVQAQDRAMGNNFDDGASVLAGAKTVQKEGAVRSYHWAFGIEQVIEALVRTGPVILGINWYESMYSTNKKGLVEVSGPIVGGHCIMTNGFWPAHPDFGDVVVWTNSWGPYYGLGGRGYIRVSDLDRLLKEDGEACVPTDAPVKP